MLLLLKETTDTFTGTVVKNGVVVEFVMNKTCAAGTGSFLVEQADRINVSLEQFSEMAFRAKNPVDMGTRCTVFMETDCIHYQYC